jgi:hypothetical protein
MIIYTADKKVLCDFKFEFCREINRCDYLKTIKQPSEGMGSSDSITKKIPEQMF